ncbi:MAG: cysteine--tRNA ligase [Candidatus Paceibacterota bacterium]|jgi:cysteinyl-tRNA synthetase
MLLYNTLTKQKEEFRPISSNEVLMYTCGPTVYDYAHIGNFRSYIVTDFLRRTLEYLGYKVIQVKNITDVGHLTQDDIDEGADKIEEKAKKEKLSPKDIAKHYEDAFRSDEKTLNIEPAEFYPRATENIPEMIEAVKTLIDKEFAYENDGAVFFDVTKFKDYGKLSGNTLEKLETGSRIKPDPRKKNPFDFYLWRPAEKDHLMQWDSPWGKGYPGWHIECSVMSRKFLGVDTLDIHTGGEDNIFPHHENEIAQSENLTGKPFANFWFHPRHLLVDGEKMAKSKGNFYILKNILDKGYGASVFRLLVFSTHYRSPLDFSWKALDQAKANLETIVFFLDRLREDIHETEKETMNSKILTTKTNFLEFIKNDLDAPNALSVVLEFIEKVNNLIDEGKISKNDAVKIEDFIMDINQIIGIDLKRIIKRTNNSPEDIKKLAEERYKLKEQKKYNEADKIRDKIEAKGYNIMDTSTRKTENIKPYRIYPNNPTGPFGPND